MSKPMDYLKTPSINTLVEDIYGTLDGKGHWDDQVSEDLQLAIDNLMGVRLAPEDGPRKGTIRMSNAGQPCGRKLWYHVNSDKEGEPLPHPTKLKFMYGDFIEQMLLSLAEAAGHDVAGRQDELKYGDIVGHRDAVIDGMLIDVKSASTFSYKKFATNSLKEKGNDSFGYIGQLATYLLASQDDPLVTNKTHAGFLAMDKQFGHICLDIYNLEEDMERMSKLIPQRVDSLTKGDPPSRTFHEVPYQKSGNMCLPVVCSYCEHKRECWPGVRGFMYSGKPVWLTKVVREPKDTIQEIL